MDSSESRKARALRRASYPGEVVRAGQPKPCLYDEMSLQQRFINQAQLVARQFAASSTLLRESRSNWPGEIFRIGSR